MYPYKLTCRLLAYLYKQLIWPYISDGYHVLNMSLISVIIVGSSLGESLGIPCKVTYRSILWGICCSFRSKSSKIVMASILGLYTDFEISAKFFTW